MHRVAGRARTRGRSQQQHRLPARNAEGTLTAEATPIHRGRTQQLWEVRITDENDRLVSKGQVRLANITEVAKIGKLTTRQSIE